MLAADGHGVEETRIQQESTSGTLQHTDQLKSNYFCSPSTIQNTKRLKSQISEKVLPLPFQYSRWVMALATAATVLLAATALYNVLAQRDFSSRPTPSSSLHLGKAESCLDPCK